jgi:alkylhydroperoxidase family enzyme
MVYFFARRQFGKVATPIAVFSARMLARFLAFYGKVSKPDQELEIPARTAMLIREQVASTNTCLFCMDASRWYAFSDNAVRFDALPEYRTRPPFSPRPSVLHSAT